MQNLLNSILNDCSPYINEGEVATYIPELANVDKNEFGISIITNDNNIYSVGDCDKLFTMQSVIKPVILVAALIDNGIETVKNFVGVEATGKPFDAFNYSDLSLKPENINPMINMGAIELCSLIKGDTFEEKLQRLLMLTRRITSNPNLEIDKKVYLSEKETGNKNRALAYMLKAYGMLSGNVEDVLDVYFSACSIKASTIDIARMALVFANGGMDIVTGEQLFDKHYAKYINAILITSGMYDGSAEFAINVGIPAKSGVGGGIMAVVPNRMGIGLYSPSLNSKGNSIAGIKALEQLSDKLDLSIF